MGKWIETAQGREVQGRGLDGKISWSVNNLEGKYGEVGTVCTAVFGGTWEKYLRRYLSTYSTYVGKAMERKKWIRMACFILLLGSGFAQKSTLLSYLASFHRRYLYLSTELRDATSSNVPAMLCSCMLFTRINAGYPFSFTLEKIPCRECKWLPDSVTSCMKKETLNHSPHGKYINCTEEMTGIVHVPMELFKRRCPPDRNGLVISAKMEEA